MHKLSPRLPSNAGIAIGPILFMLALIGIIAAVVSVGGNSDFGAASATDRIATDITSQANLIRTKINECNTLFGSNENYDGYPASASSGSAVSSLICGGDPASNQNIWTGVRATQLPPPTSGFNAWNYINTDTCTYTAGSNDCAGSAATGGRCIWTTPINPSSAIAGLTKAATKFTSATSNDGSSEVNYNPSSASQKFVLWITLPTGTADSHCVP